MKKKLHRIKINTKAVADLLKKWKKTRKLKDKCIVCGERDKITFHKHHIDGNKKNNLPSNLIKICASCHSITWKAKTPKEAREAFIKRYRKVNNTVKIWKNKRRKRKWWSYKNKIRVRAKT